MSKVVKKMLLPNVRFPEFSDAGKWDSKELGKVAALITEKAGSNRYTLMSVTAGLGLVTQIEKFGKEIAGEAYKNYYVIKKGDFAYNKSSTKQHPEGQMALLENVEQGAVPNSIFTCFRVDQESVSPYFLKYPFATNIHGKWLRNFIAVGARANGALNVDSKDLLTLPIVFPSLKEQQKITDCLSSIDELISTQSQKVEALKTHKKGLMQQLFPREGETIPRLRFPEFRDAGGWEKKTFEELVAKSFYGTSSSTSPTGQYPVLRMGNMADGGLDFTNLVYIDLNPDSFESLRLEDGDILLNRTNSPALVGKISIFRHKSECITASYIVTYRLNKKLIDPPFCNFMLNTPRHQSKIKAFAKPSISQANINPTTFKKELIVIVPALKEQQKIAACLTSIDALISAHSQKLATLKTHKKGLMQALFPADYEVGA